MARFLKNRSKLIGKAPGSVVFIGNKKMDLPRFRLISFNESDIVEYESDNLEKIFQRLDKDKTHWINIDGIHDTSAILAIEKLMNLSPLQTEGIANTDQRPRMIDGRSIVIFLKMLDFRKEDTKVISDQLSLIFSKNILVTFQENVGTLFNPIRERLRLANGKLRNYKADYLCYRIMDAVADNYLISIGNLGELIELNEGHILKKESSSSVIEEIYHYKTEISYIRKAIWPVKEITTQLKNSDSELINEETLTYFNGLEDLITHSIESTEIYYTMISDQLNIYNSNLANRTNDVMKTLTIFSSIFIPITFITGIYGTNFDYLPELHLKFGYFAMWGIIIMVIIALLLYFRNKRWL